jgi:uncharacterized membrane protein YedE/YeeE
VKSVATALLSGTIFGSGLAVARMTNPAKVLAFLDVAGAWDPSLAFVMGAALAVSALAYRFRPAPSGIATGIDARLLVGAGLFGLGWGLAGFCPGPAIASLSTGSGEVVTFVLAMVVGMLLFDLLFERLQARAPREPSP